MLPEIDSLFMQQLIFALCLMYVQSLDMSTRDLIVFLSSVMFVYASIDIISGSLAQAITGKIEASTGVIRSIIDLTIVVNQTCSSLIAVTLSGIAKTMPLRLNSVVLLIVMYTLAKRRLTSY